MHSQVVMRIIGILLMLFSFTMVPPMLVGLIYFSEGAIPPFVKTFLLTLVSGFLLYWPLRRVKLKLRLRDGFMVVVLFWTVLSLFGALPFIFYHAIDIPDMSVTDAVFESVSGLTTTGATVITTIDQLPHSILYYRQQLQWLGGMGIVVLAVAVMPMLGIGGMQLYRAEAPGPMKDSRLTPRIAETAKALWYIYLGLTVACALAYWAAGMTLFNAIGHSFSTVAIGGFSTHDASMGYYSDTPMIEVVAIIFMFVAGINFALHFMAWRGRTTAPYHLDEELQVYIMVLLGVGVITVGYLYFSGHFDSLYESALHGLFQTVSMTTTTGFTTSDYHNWPSFLPVLLLFASFIGGCAGSTGGGMKVIRFVLLLKQGKREVAKLIHPNAVIPIKISGKPMPDKVISAVWGFLATYVALFSMMMLTLMATGLDQVTAFSAVAACMNNMGPGHGEVGYHYGTLSDTAKWVLCFAMLLGRLEIFTLLVIFTPVFWRR
ncbi:potassium transporter [Ectothiorhodospiraceae bacterium BW-2]|nr:potassium transporter [Ectothiorhodospiraceae bacterium BW-2]